MNYTYLVFDETMKHHGVKGMHWGIRRYQNPDGSWKPEGKKRYKAELSKDRENFQKERNDAIRYREGAKLASKHINKLEKKVNKALRKDPNASKKSTVYKQMDLASRKEVRSDFEKKAKDSLKRAQKLNKTFLEKYGSKEISELKYNKKGELKDNNIGKKFIKDLLLRFVASPAVYQMTRERSEKEIGQNMYRDAVYDKNRNKKSTYKTNQNKIKDIDEMTDIRKTEILDSIRDNPKNLNATDEQLNKMYQKAWKNDTELISLNKKKKELTYG